MLPLELASSFKILSSFFCNYSLSLAIDKTSSSLVVSTSGISLKTTSAKNYSCSPSAVTVKLMIVTLMNTSGRKLGFASLLVKNILKLGSKSIV
jgi:hypothetical protein